MKEHWILMGGIPGCMPAHISAHPTQENALDSFKCIYNIWDREWEIRWWNNETGKKEWIPFDLDPLKEILKQDGIFYLSAYAVRVKDYFGEDETTLDQVMGNQYISISPCDCPEPWVHEEECDKWCMEEWKEWLQEDEDV